MHGKSEKKCGRYTCPKMARSPSAYCSRHCQQMHYAHLRKAKARQRAFVAKKTGVLSVPSSCQLCDNAVQKLVAHHWHGYTDEHATNVWWICQGCNMKLLGDMFHDGSISLSEARSIVAERSA